MDKAKMMIAMTDTRERVLNSYSSYLLIARFPTIGPKRSEKAAGTTVCSRTEQVLQAATFSLGMQICAYVEYGHTLSSIFIFFLSFPVRAHNRLNVMGVLPAWSKVGSKPGSRNPPGQTTKKGIQPLPATIYPISRITSLH